MGIASNLLQQYPSLRHDDHDHDHDHDHQDNASPIVAKVVAMCVLFLVSMTLGCLPIQLSKWFKWKENPRGTLTVNLLLCVGGGVLLCTTFLHLLPEVAENLNDLQTDGVFPELDFHLAELLMCAGFFTMYFVEECVHVYLSNQQTKDAEVFQRTLSVRRGETPNQDSDKECTNNNGPEQYVDNHERSHVGHSHVGHSHAEHSHVGHSHLEHSHLGHSHLEHGHVGHSHVGHSHLVAVEDSLVQSVRGLLMVLALSVHEIFEGLAVGLEPESASVWYMFGAVSAHKFVIAFCIGVELVAVGTRKVLAAVYVFTFAVVSPLGIGIGILVSGSSGSGTDVVSVILQGLASGTLLYVVFFEILQADRKSGLLQWFAVVAGFGLMFVFTLFAHHDHDHDH